MEASSGSVDSSLFKSWSPGVGWGHNWGIKFYIGIYRENLKKSSTQEYMEIIFFSKTIRPEKLKLKWKHPQVVQIQVCSNYGPRGQGGAPRGGSCFTQEYIEKIFKNLLLKHYQAREAQIKVEASSGSVDSSLFKSWSPGLGWGHNQGIKFYIEIY